MVDSRVILHVDMDAFFASVEQLDAPELRGKPVLVGGTGRRGVVAAASYEAREFGCHSAQPTAVALRLCPHAIVVRPRGRRYREISDAVFELFHTVTPVVEPLSIDEAFLDVTGSRRLLGTGEQIAANLRERIREKIGLTASVGVAPNKFIAKLASDMRKPDGMMVIRAECVEAILDPLPVEKMWGVGAVTARKLREVGIRTFGDLRAMPPEVARSRMGRSGARLVALAAGADRRAVTPDYSARSISHEQTFGADLTHPEHALQVLLMQTESVGQRLRRHGFLGRTITLKIRFGDYTTITRSSTLPQQSCRTDELWQVAKATFDRWASTRFRPIRLIGMGVTNLERAAGPPSLFVDEVDVRREQVDQATDAINQKFGRRTIQRAGGMGTPRENTQHEPIP